MKMAEPVQGDKLYLRRLCSTDLDRTWEWLHRPDVYSKIGVQVPFTKEQQQQWFAALQKDESKIVFAVCRNEDDAHIGNVSIDMIDRRHWNARFSIFIADKEVRGKGFGSEALALLEQAAFKQFGLHKVWCKTDAGDSGVLQFYEKAGYIQEGLLKEHEMKDGRFVDKVIFAKIQQSKVEE